MRHFLRNNSFSLAEKTGFIALGAAVLLLFIWPYLAVIVLSFFLLLCFAAPFFPGFAFFLPIISRGQAGNNGVALTFDDGPSPLSTPVILDLLARHRLRATFFVVGEKAAGYPDLIAGIIAGGHTIGNHSLNHDSFLMLRSRKTLQRNIHTTQEILQKQGVQPLVFRPPVGITSPRLGEVLAREGLVAVTYSCRAYDRGNRKIDNLAGKILATVRPGDIIMLHDLPAYRESRSGESGSAYLHEQLDRLFAALAEHHTVVPLEQIIRRPVHIAGQ